MPASTGSKPANVEEFTAERQIDWFDCDGRHRGGGDVPRSWAFGFAKKWASAELVKAIQEFSRAGASITTHMTQNLSIIRGDPKD